MRALLGVAFFGLAAVLFLGLRSSGADEVHFVAPVIVAALGVFLIASWAADEH